MYYSKRHPWKNANHKDLSSKEEIYWEMSKITMSSNCDLQRHYNVKEIHDPPHQFQTWSSTDFILDVSSRVPVFMSCKPAARSNSTNKVSPVHFGKEPYVYCR